ncbi:MAG: NAD-dependent epimerase/dehydratase family protein [bacterium]|nr:NAD-dependent epimerase/dehydratase family protein [bacterium]
MKVLIIGGTRRVGPHLVRGLSGRGHQVTVFHRGISQATLPPGVSELIGDRRDYARFAEQMAAVDCDVVVDMVCSDDHDARSLVENFATRVRRAVVISSYEVYSAYEDAWNRRSSQQPMPIREDAPKRAQVHLYGTDRRYDKVLVEEEILKAGGEGFPYCILRWPALYGPGDTTPREWYYVRQALDRRRWILLPGGGQSIFCRGYLENMAVSICLAVESPQACRQIYNAADTQALTNRQIAEAVAEIVGHRWDVVSVPRTLAPQVPQTQALPFSVDPYDIEPHLQFDLTKIRTDLGYEDKVAPDRALARTVRWLCDNPPPAAWLPVSYDDVDRALSAACVHLDREDNPNP